MYQAILTVVASSRSLLVAMFLSGILVISASASDPPWQFAEPTDTCLWSEEFENSGLDGRVRSAAVWDDGRGPALYAGGDFRHAGTELTEGVARWDGTSWKPLTDSSGNGSCSVLQCRKIDVLEVFDDGGGAQLYAGTTYQCGGEHSAIMLGRWDGDQWSLVFDACGFNYLNSAAVYDDGFGSALYLAGDPIYPWYGVTQFDGESWIGLEGISWGVDELEVWDDGHGSSLYAAGNFQMAGELEANGIASWGGQGWSTLTGPAGTGLEKQPENLWVWVSDMVAFDDGDGEALYVAGSFLSAGGIVVNNIARWNGLRWTALEGMRGVGTNGTVYALAVYDNGLGKALYVSGHFSRAGGVNVSGFARWDGNAWSPSCESGADINTFVIHDDGNGESLFAGGSFSEVCGVSSAGIARLTCSRFDFGDAPEPPYPTLAISNGPKHTIRGGLHLGTTIDHEPDGLPSSRADGDGSDDDGISFSSPMIAGFLSSLEVISSLDAVLDGWIDFNADGDWDDSGERVFDHQTVSSGTNEMSFTVPGTAISGTVTIARFRLSSAGTDSPLGSASDGEVEDYEIVISPNPTRRTGGRVRP